MKGKKLLAAFLLGVGLCFVPALGYGEVREELYEEKTPIIDFILLDAKVNYMMRNPTNFSDVALRYDAFGLIGLLRKFPKGIETKGKIFVKIRDSRNIFLYKSRIALLDEFKKELEILYSFIEHIAPNMYTDVVAKFYSQGDIPLGYFYQGEYHLWGE